MRFKADKRLERIAGPRRRGAVAVRMGVAVAAALGSQLSVRATPQVYIGGSGNWSDSSNWSNGTTPGSGDDAQLVQNAATNAVNVSFDPGASASNLNSLVTDGTATRAMTLTQATNALATITESVGVNGLGILNLNGGTHSVTGAGSNSLFIGVNQNGVGTVNLAGATLNIADSVYVGVSGSGTFKHTAGNANINGFLTLGGDATGTAVAGSGSYTFSGGALTAGGVYAGMSGVGTFTQTKGNASYGLITIGYLPASVGAYTISGGTIFNNNAITVGAYGTGSYTQSGGTVITGGMVLGDTGAASSGTLQFSGGSIEIETALVVGSVGAGNVFQTGGAISAARLVTNTAFGSPDGTYQMSGNSTLHVFHTPDGNGGFYNGIEYLGYQGNFTFTQDNGAHTVDGYLAMAVQPNSQATYIMNGGSLAAPAQSIGYGSGANNTFTQNAGSNTAVTFITVGDQVGARGTYFMNGGVMNVDTFYTGAHGNGVLQQSGGTINVDELIVGLDTPSKGTVTLSAGLLKVGTSEEIGYAGNGVFTQTGGTHTVASSGTVTIGVATSAAGVYNLRAGAFTAGTVINNRTFNQFGGSATFGAMSGTSGVTTLTGTNAAATVLNTGSITQATVSIGNNSKVLITPAISVRATNVIGTLTMTGTGTFDLANSDLVLNGTYKTVNTGIKANAGAASGALGLNPWSGSTGIISSLVKTDATNGHPNAVAIGVVDHADFVASGSGKNVPAGKVLVSYAAYGDANLDNIVDIADLSIWNNNFFIGDHWGQGDFNYDGVVDIADLSIWNNNFFHSVSPAAAVTTPTRNTFSAAARTLSGSTAVGAPVAPATPPVNTLELDIDPTTGDATINSGGVSIAAVEIDSAAKDLITANWKSFKNFYHVSGWSFAKGVPNTAVVAEFTSDASSSGTPIALAAGSLTDYGNIVPVGFSNISDLTFKYNIVLDAAGNTQSKVGLVVIGVPEPASLGIIALAGAGLLRRRRTMREKRSRVS